jgi:hypothetical protein
VRDGIVQLAEDEPEREWRAAIAALVEKITR